MAEAAPAGGAALRQFPDAPAKIIDHDDVLGSKQMESKLIAACATHVSSGNTSFGSSGSQFGGSDVGPYDQEPSSKYLSATRQIHDAMQ